MKYLLVVFLLCIFQISYGQDTVTCVSDSVSIPRNSFLTQAKSLKVLGYVAPTLLLSYGLSSLENKPIQSFDKHIRHELLEANPDFSTHWDDRIRYLPLMAVYSLNLLGVKGKNGLFDRTAIYLMSNLIMSKSVDFLKDKSHKLRPSQSDSRSFPSGHTALAFGAAEFMRLEFKDKSPWYGYAAYSVAATTGALRMLNNAHWLSDVLAGAGVGILSAKASYALYPWLKKKIIGQNDLQIRSVPFLQKGAVGYSIVVQLN